MTRQSSQADEEDRQRAGQVRVTRDVKPEEVRARRPLLSSFHKVRSSSFLCSGARGEEREWRYIKQRTGLGEPCHRSWGGCRRRRVRDPGSGKAWLWGGGSGLGQR